MQKKLNIYQIDAFTKHPFQGNSAGVAFGDSLTKPEMQLIAREMNLAETAFLSKSDKADYNLRWFTPTTEVELCGHATIASLHFLSEEGLLKKNSSVNFDTLSGILKCYRDDEKYFMQIPVFSMKEYSKNRDAILSALDINKSALDESVPFILLKNGYLYIYVKKITALKNLKPDFKALLKLSNQKDFNAVTVFTLETLETGNFAHLRFFAPYFGIDEDPVTGSANGPLLLVLKKLGFIKEKGMPAGKAEEISLTFEQGDFIGRKGRVSVKYSPDKNLQAGKVGELYISGNAVTVLKGDLLF